LSGLSVISGSSLSNYGRMARISGYGSLAILNINEVIESAIKGTVLPDI